MSGAAETRLDDLALQAAALDGPAAGAEPEAVEAPLVNGETQDERNTRAIGFALAMIREATASTMLLDPPLRTLAERMPDDVVEKIAGPWGKVATHYGIDLMTDIDHPAIKAVLMTGPLLWGIGAALAGELRDRSKPKRRADAESGD